MTPSRVRKVLTTSFLISHAPSSRFRPTHPRYTPTTNGPPPNRQRTRKPLRYRTERTAGRHHHSRSKGARGWWAGILVVNGRFSPNHAMTPKYHYSPECVERLSENSRRTLNWGL